MIINDRLTKMSEVPNTPDNILLRRFFTSITASIEKFKIDFTYIGLNTLPGETNRIKRLTAITLTLKSSLSSSNKDFREIILNTSRENRRKSMYCLSCNGVSLDEIIQKLFDFKIYRKKLENGAYEQSYINFTESKFHRVFEIALAMLFTKFQSQIYEFQYLATAYMVLIEFFDPDTYDMTAIINVIERLKQYNIKDLDRIVKEYRLKKNKTIRKNSRNDKFPTREEYLAYFDNEYPATKIQKELAEKFKVSPRSIQRDMAKKGLTNQKYTTKSTKNSR